MAAKKYTVLLGYNAPPDGERHEPGEEVYLTTAAARPLLALGAVEHITETREHPEQTADAIDAATPDEDGDE